MTFYPFCFSDIFIPRAVWEELTNTKDSEQVSLIKAHFKDKVRDISKFNDLTFVMDFGESEAVILCKELAADYLLIDDKEARAIA